MNGNFTNRLVLSIDPGINSTGWALFDGKKLLNCGTIHPPKSFCESEKLTHLGCQIDILINAWRDKGIGVAHIETPRPYSYTRSSAQGVGLNQESLDKNQRLVGALMYAIVGAGWRPELVYPDNWKGKESKSQTNKIAELIYKVTVESQDCKDAVAMGHRMINKIKTN